MKTIPDCGCATVGIEAGDLDAGESRVLPLTFRTGTARGSITKSVAVIYRIAGSAERFLVRVPIRAQVVPDYEIQPSRLFFERGLATAQTLTITPRRNRDPVPRLISVSCRGAGLRASIEDGDLLSGESTVRVSYAPDATAETNPERREIHLAFANTAQPTLIIPITLLPRRSAVD